MSVSNITSKLGNKVKVFTKTVAVAALLHSPMSSPAMTKALTSDVAKFSHTIDADVATTTMSKMMKKAAKFVGKSESSVPGDPPAYLMVSSKPKTVAKAEAVSKAPAARRMKLIGQNAEYSVYDITNDKKALDSLSFKAPKKGELSRDLVLFGKAKKAGEKNLTAVYYETEVVPEMGVRSDKIVLSGSAKQFEGESTMFFDGTLARSTTWANDLMIMERHDPSGKKTYTLTNLANKNEISISAKNYEEYESQLRAPYNAFINFVVETPEFKKVNAAKEAAYNKAVAEAAAAPAPAPSTPKFAEGLNIIARDGDYTIYDLTKNEEVYDKLNLDSDAVKRIVFAVNNTRDDASMVMVNYKLEKSSIGSRIKTTFSGLGETLEIDTVRLANGTKDILSFVDDGPAIVKSTSAKGIKKYLLNDPDKGQKFDLTLTEYQELEKDMYSQYNFLMKHAKKQVQVKSAKEELMASIKSRGKSTGAKPATGPGHVFIATEGNFDISDVTKDKALLSKITGETRAAVRALSFDNKAHADSSFYEVAYPNTSVVDDYGHKTLSSKTYWIGDQSPTIMLEYTSRDKVFKKYYTNKATGQTIWETSVMGKNFYNIQKNALRQVELTAEEFNKMKDEWLSPYSPLLKPAGSEVEKPVARSSDAFDAFNLLMMHNQAINGLDQIVRDDAEFFRNLYGTTNPFIH